MINSACVRVHWRTLPDSLEPCTCRQQASQLLCFSITHSPALQPETTIHFLSFFKTNISVSVNQHTQTAQVYSKQDTQIILYYAPK